MDGISFVREIESLLAKRGIQKEDFYKDSGITSATMSQYRSGLYNPSKKTIAKASAYFGITVSELVKQIDPTFKPTVFYTNFIKLCNQEGITPTGLVLKLGLSSSNASVWKNGGTPRPDALRKIADYFGVTTDYLLSENEKTPSEPQSEGLQAEFVRLFNALTPEQQARELAYLRELTGGKDR